MRPLLFFMIFFSTIAVSAFGELTSQDLDKIRLIFHEAHAPIKAEIAALKTEIVSLKKDVAALKTDVAALKTDVAALKTDVASLKEDMAGLNGRIESIDKVINWLMALILVAVGVPQIVVAWRSRKDREQDRKFEQLTQEIETLKQQITNP